MSNLERDVLSEPWFNLFINGRRLDEELLKFVEEVQIEDEEDALPLARITIQDYSGTWREDWGIHKGSNIKVKAGHRLSNRYMFDGQITHVEADFPDTGMPTIIIGAVDKAIALQKEQKAKVWKNRKVSDVIKEIFKSAGLKCEVEDTKVVLPHINRMEESNLDFLTRWRKRLNWRFYRVGIGDYYFGTKRKSTVTKTLGYKTGGLEIISFTPQYVEFETDDTSDKEEVDNEKGEKKTVKSPKKKTTTKSTSKTKKPIGKA